MSNNETKEERKKRREKIRKAKLERVYVGKRIIIKKKMWYEKILDKFSRTEKREGGGGGGRVIK